MKEVKEFREKQMTEIEVQNVDIVDRDNSMYNVKVSKTAEINLGARLD